MYVVVYIFNCIYVSTLVAMHVHARVSVYIYTYVCVCKQTYTYVCMYVSVCVCVCVANMLEETRNTLKGSYDTNCQLQ
jgi:small basic protein